MDAKEIIQIDFVKALDSIKWYFLIKCLKAFNFGDNFIKWLTILYTDIKACVGNNGYCSSYFQLSRSILQGCPISTLLFLLVVICIRSDNNIEGIDINNTVLKLSIMADDTTLIIKNLKSLSIALTHFHFFNPALD